MRTPLCQRLGAHPLPYSQRSQSQIALGLFTAKSGLWTTTLCLLPRQAHVALFDIVTKVLGGLNSIYFSQF